MVEVLGGVLFLLWCNFVPPLANLFLHRQWSTPVDFGRRWTDGQPLFGPHKTWRGITAAVAGGALAAPLLGLTWQEGAMAAGLAMAGDLGTSFCKRRFDLASGASAPVFDQLCESLLPLLYLRKVMALSWGEAAVVLLLFVPVTYLGSRFWGYLLRTPPGDYPRLIRSAVRWREWRACHQPLARWHRWFNFESVLFYRLFMRGCFKLAGLYRRGRRNALELQMHRVDLAFPNLPAGFHGFRILFLSDLHLDGLDGLAEAVSDGIKGEEVDLCLLGGDIRMEMYGPIAPAVRRLRKVLAGVRSVHGVFGVLGNHDCIEMVPELEDAGVVMLVNSAQVIERRGESIWLVGLDDPHFYRVHDPAHAFREVAPGAFAILVAHSPEAYLEAASYGPALYLCGHTHGGQVRLPGRGPIFTHSRAPRFMSEGRWSHAGMQGYTSRGVGASGVAVRFNCPPEITLFTLKRGG